MDALRDALRGITPPLVTPFDGTAIDLPAFESVVDHVLDGGVDALFVCGTTGEAASLSRSERRDLLRHTVDYAPPDVPVLVGGTGTAVDDTRAWIDEAAECGADGVFLTAPYFHTANSPGGYRAFFDPIVADSPLPIVLYNIPGYVGHDVPQDLVIELAARDRVLGIKDSGGDLDYGMTLTTGTPADFLVLQGVDALLLPSLRVGFDGGVNAGANVLPETYGSVVSRPCTDDSLSSHHESIRPLFTRCEEHGFAPGIKAALVERDVIPRPDVRPPHVAVESD